MGNHYIIQICQFKDGEFPNEKNIERFQIFQMDKKMSEKDLKEYIKSKYKYCICRQKIYFKEYKEIEKKYPYINELKYPRIYVSISKNKNCRCDYNSFEDLKNQVKKEFKLLHEENKNLKTKVKEKNGKLNGIYKKLKNILSNMQKIKFNENIKSNE